MRNSEGSVESPLSVRHVKRLSLSSDGTYMHMYAADKICIKAGEESPLILSPPYLTSPSVHYGLAKELIHAW